MAVVTRRGEVVDRSEHEGVDPTDERREPQVVSQSWAGPAPRITAFIWGGKVRPQPTLPFGRWKHVA